MKILSLELHLFKRLSLNNITTFTIDMTEPLQLILGTNGSGKSSIVYQLSPLPADSKDFHKGGYKKIKIQHNNKHYTLTSSFNIGQKHSFIIDDIELNEGGTVSVQRELVKQHFNYALDIHNLAIGKEPFDRMSPNRRKEWFLRLCDTNYDYAIKVYNRLKERLRDTSGAIKMAKKRLSVETEKVVKEEEEKRLHKEISEYHSILNELLEYRKPPEFDLEMLVYDQRAIDDEIKTTINKIESVHDKITENDIESINIIIKTCELELFSISKRLTEETGVFLDRQKKIDILKKAEQSTVKSLNDDIDKLQKEIDRLEKLLIVKTLSDPLKCHSVFDGVKIELTELLSEFPINKDNYFSKEKMLSTNESIGKLTVSINDSEKDYNRVCVEMDHMLSHKDNNNIECPNCQHKFSTSYNDTVYKRMSVFKNKTEEDLAKKRKELTELKSYLTECQEYSIKYRHIVNVLNAYPELNSYWSIIKESKLLTENPKEIIHLLNDYSNDILNHINIKRIKDELNEKKVMSNSLKDVGGLDLNRLIADNEKSESLISNLSSSQNKTIDKKKEYERKRDIVIQLGNLSNRVRELINDKKKVSRNEIETIRRIHYDQMIKSVQNALASNVNVLEGFKAQQRIIEDIQNQISKLSHEEESLSHLVSVLSPTDGLIAEGLVGFITSFVSQMNYFIRNVWSYSLEVQPCGFDDEETVDLNYKFPVYVKSDDNQINDVSEGSTGMLDIINLAFRITAMQYLRLNHYPLALDEWGSGFDSVHRHQAVNAIKSLVDQKIFDQLFIISHYAESFGALSNPEVCVLDSSNIDLPRNLQNYNKHVVIN